MDKNKEFIGNENYYYNKQLKNKMSIRQESWFYILGRSRLLRPATCSKDPKAVACFYESAASRGILRILNLRFSTGVTF